MDSFKYISFVKFKDKQKTYTFGSNQIFKINDKVIVETVKGNELGIITKPSEVYDKDKIEFELKPILRLATKNDIKNYEENIQKAKKALKICQDSIKQLSLDMQLIDAEYTLDRKKITFEYLADDRVDFRELLKILASKLHCRIELRQVGPRYKAQIVGGLGQCGRETCCSKFLSDMDMISINMAKNQFLALNIQKLSGQCGKLKCCLKYEDDIYTELKDDLPKINSKVMYNNEKYKVTGINVLKGEAKIEKTNEVLFVDITKLEYEEGKDNE